MRWIAFTTAVSLPLFLIDLIEALLPIEGALKYAVTIAIAALLMASAVGADNWLQRQKVSSEA